MVDFSREELLLKRIEERKWDDVYLLWSSKLPWEHVLEPDGKNVFAYLASIGDLEACKFLLQKAACPYATDLSGQNALDLAKTKEIRDAIDPEPLVRAIIMGDAKKTQAFLEEKPYMINVYTKGNVPLCNFAISQRTPIKVLETILKFSPDLYLPDEDFVTAIDVALAIKYDEAYNLLSNKMQFIMMIPMTPTEE